jgi:hypothetical protein
VEETKEPADMRAFRHLRDEYNLQSVRSLKRKNPNLTPNDIEALALEWVRLLGFNDSKPRRMSKMEAEMQVMGLGMLIWFFGFDMHDIKNHTLNHYRNEKCQH